MEDGYVLHTHPSWLKHHFDHSEGGRVAFMRGPNASFARFRGGELLIFLVAGTIPHEIAGVATFVRNNITTLGDAWSEYGGLLGAGTFADFLQIAPIENPDSKSATAVLEAENFRKIEPRIGITDAGIVDKQGATRGWYTTSDETDRLLAQLEESHTTAQNDGVQEGDRVVKSHLRLERNKTIVALAKRRWLELDPNLACEVCGFSFLARYGPIGEGFIEAHHRTPLSELAAGFVRFTRESDLAPVCGNCHRMLHAGSGCTIEEVRGFLR